MISLFYFIRLAVRNLFRSDQRTLVALLCITFGIMSLVAMTMLAKSIESAVQMEPAQHIGGDLSINREKEDTISPIDAEQLDQLQQEGLISRYTLIAFTNGSLSFHTPGSAELHFVSNGMGIEPDKYPLAGSLTIGEPGSIGLPTLLQRVGDVVITRDLVEEYRLHVGDTIFLSDLSVGFPLQSVIRGVAYDTPNHQGGKIYYSIATAQALAGDEPVVNVAIANSSQVGSASSALSNSGWLVNWVAGQATDRVGNVWMICLRGAGILGLLVGGIGIANTMQVLLRRRQKDVAILKTLGYSVTDLHLVFTLEAGLLGLAGSLLGAGLGVLCSSGLLELFKRTSSLLYQWTFSPTPPIMGLLIGILTTLIFAYWAIATSGQAKPMALLRNEPIEVRHLASWQTGLLGLLLSIPFFALTSLVMGSALTGIGVLVAILLGVTILGGFFSAALWIFTRFLPLKGFPLVRLAVSNLRRHPLAIVFAMIALFIGVLAMSLGITVWQMAGSRISGPIVNIQGYNVELLASADQESAIRQAVLALDPRKISMGYRTQLESLQLISESSADHSLDAVLVGRSDPQDYVISGAAWGSRPEGVYVYEGSGINMGSQIEATFLDGTSRIFNVIGYYNVNYDSMTLYPSLGLLIPMETFIQVAQPDALTVFVQFDPRQVHSTVTTLGKSLPQATVIDLEAYASRYMQAYQRLYALPIAMAGLALLAGLLLLANSVSLAVMDRRYDIGVFKTIGYARRQILTMFAVEYGLVSLMATGVALLIIQGLLALLALTQSLDAAVLLMNAPSLVIAASCGIGLSLATVIWIAWSPTQVPPAAILREQT
jgi:putative ABC transport system permease protein